MIKVTTKVKWSGDKFTNKIIPQIEQALLKIGFKIEHDAKKAVPVDTGRLKASIATVGTSGPAGYAVKVGTNVSYAIYVEMGTRKMKARPYLYPAFKIHVNDVKRELKVIVSKP